MFTASMMIERLLGDDLEILVTKKALHRIIILYHLDLLKILIKILFNKFMISLK
jgi:hypothetical protein